MNYYQIENYFKKHNVQSVKLLLIANILIFLLFHGNPLVHKLFALHPLDVYNNFYLWECITYAFLHGDFFHLLCNMLALWFLGYELETLWGTKKFLTYYFIVAAGAGMITALYMILYLGGSYVYIPTIGASGAVFGLLIPYTILFPNRLVYVYGLFPVKVKSFAIVAAIVSLIYSIKIDHSSNTSHICHLSGMLVGAGYLFYEYKLKKIINTLILTNRKKSNHLKIKRTAKYEMKKKYINDILDKINNSGWEALSDEEKQYLKKESSIYYDTKKPN